MFCSSPLGNRLRAAARDACMSTVALFRQLLLGSPTAPDRAGTRHTLLAVCPNSEAVARAALGAAQEARTPLLYAATLNQVDRDGGYTGWTPHDLASFVEADVERQSVDVPVFLGLDHGGPWAKDAHSTNDLNVRPTRPTTLSPSTSSWTGRLRSCSTPRACGRLRKSRPSPTRWGPTSPAAGWRARSEFVRFCVASGRPSTPATFRVPRSSSAISVPLPIPDASTRIGPGDS
ncbi:MAG: hypothetical protein BRD41_06790 [Bacteroidetes bacterium QS_1_63_11]|nr:MAG: hypothetical protein BRD41_06790 [Bacteroidetes bacterium QS_1_63_11]